MDLKENMVFLNIQGSWQRTETVGKKAAAPPGNSKTKNYNIQNEKLFDGLEKKLFEKKFFENCLRKKLRKNYLIGLKKKRSK